MEGVPRRTAQPRIERRGVRRLLVLVLAYNGILATAYAQWASVRMTQLLPAVTVSLGLLLVPVAGLGLATFWLREPFTLSLGIGMVLIIGGLVLQVVRRRRVVDVP